MRIEMKKKPFFFETFLRNYLLFSSIHFILCNEHHFNKLHWTLLFWFRWWCGVDKTTNEHDYNDGDGF